MLFYFTVKMEGRTAGSTYHFLLIPVHADDFPVVVDKSIRRMSDDKELPVQSVHAKKILHKLQEETFLVIQDRTAECQKSTLEVWMQMELRLINIHNDRKKARSVILRHDDILEGNRTAFPLLPHQDKKRNPYGNHQLHRGIIRSPGNLCAENFTEKDQCGLMRIILRKGNGKASFIHHAFHFFHGLRTIGKIFIEDTDRPAGQIVIQHIFRDFRESKIQAEKAAHVFKRKCFPCIHIVEARHDLPDRLFKLNSDGIIAAFIFCRQIEGNPYRKVWIQEICLLESISVRS